MRTVSPRLPACAKVFFALVVLSLSATVPARAHVKWFAAYDVASAPIGLHQVITSTFAELAVLALVLLWITCRLERTAIGSAMINQIEDAFSGVRSRTEALIRGGTAAFFTAIWAAGGIILTPELKTSSQVILWTQAAIAICTFWRATLPLSALGIAILFADGVWNYGLFHMMDYPIFLGAAGYLAMTGFGLQRIAGLRPLDVVRWGAGITLMWASVEKWAYPEWSYPVLHAHSRLTLGLSPQFYMTAAGMVEFSLSFGLLWTPLVRRLSAVVLLSMFVSAVFEFGKIDAIGHMLIVVLLIAIAADELPDARLRPSLAPIWFSAALGATILAYYLSHSAFFGTAVV
jgi:hypothetical protein